ncbi:MAG: ester cyclase [SAR202 cluster bacterium]|nr:ester cyclase [SAR202 cluster bacterium]
MTQQNRTLIHRYFDELLSKGNLAVMDQILAHNVTVYPPAYMGEPLRGIDAVRGWFTALRRAFPDFQFNLGEEFGDGNTIASTFRMHGTHKAEYMGLPATGNKIDLSGADVFKFANGRIQEIHIFYDTLGLVSQLGVVKWPPQPAPR